MNFISVKPRDLPEYNMDILECAYKSFKGNCLYVTLNTPSKGAVETLKKRTKDVSRLYVIDATQNREESDSRHMFLKSANSMVAVSLAITQAISKFKIDFIIFNSVSTFLIYETPDAVSRFMVYMINKMRAQKVSGVFVMADEPKSNKVEDITSQFADRVIKL